jgi:hypothetical protein
MRNSALSATKSVIRQVNVKKLTSSSASSVDKSATSKTDVSKSGIQVTSNTAPSVMSADRPHALLRIITAIRNAWSAAEMDILNAPLKIEAEK